ncbi:hypothetical protein CCM_04104 [Cordyceps militaris CM01]|uniref:Uncharacterized protein n=1 Tax=Cordyceps militaris (strain CM01) TaxID=983644 RepID=G3JDQ6_CORMM|nr:uncharacterized protein CCM_04104 [Cordyceps militaris CM01]EGX92731.1 hypothetical protein CCM_04104 [Cordyceps militaris CM01]
METPPGEPNGIEEHLADTDHVPHVNGHIDVNQDVASESQSTETPQHQPPDPSSPGTLEELHAFDWEDFESRYQAALLKASEEEAEILKEAESLSKYFQAWAAAASSHDGVRAVKRLQTRQRFVNLSEEKLSQKQKHYVEVVRAFEMSSFQQDFVSPDPRVPGFDGEAGESWEEEDDLGYYEDGVKRTLTDEQIEIFRHSELRELERTRERSSKRLQSGNSSEEQEIGNGQPAITATDKPRDGKKGKKKWSKQARREPKPDLRKRTWDVVEAGLDSLDYD